MELGLGATIIDLIKALNYREPSIVEFELTIDDNEIKELAEIPIDKEDGISYNLTSFTHKENHANNFNGELSLVKTVRNSSGTIISIDEITTTSASKTSAEVTVTDNNTITQEQSITYTLSGVSKNGEVIKKEKTVYFYFPHYVGTSEIANLSEDDIDELEQINVRSLEGYREIVATTDSYIWVVTPNIINDITHKGVSIGIEYNGVLTVNGTTYYKYRSINQVVADAYNINIIIQNRAVIVDGGSDGSVTKLYRHTFHMTLEFENDELGIELTGIIRGKFHGYATIISTESGNYDSTTLRELLSEIGAENSPIGNEFDVNLYPASGYVHITEYVKDPETGELTDEENQYQEAVPCGLYAEGNIAKCWFGRDNAVEITPDMDTVVEMVL